MYNPQVKWGNEEALVLGTDEECQGKHLTVSSNQPQSDPEHTTQKQLTPVLLQVQSEWKETATLVQELRRERCQLGSLTRSISAKTSREAKHSSIQRAGGEGKRKALELNHCERGKPFWLRKQGRKRGLWQRRHEVNPVTSLDQN